MPKTKIAVIFGGVSDEHDISLISAYNLLLNIPTEKYEVTCIGITKNGRWLYYPGPYEQIQTGEWATDSDCSPAVISPDSTHRGLLVFEGNEVKIRKLDAVFPMLHGKNGEDGTIQGLLQMSKIPYVGCNVASSANCMDKAITHALLDYNGIKTARWAEVSRASLNRLDVLSEKAAEMLGFPMFIKPARSGSSVGISKATDIIAVKEAIKKAFTHDDKVIIEEAIVGHELETAVFGYDNPFAAYSIGEIVPCNDFYDYDAKYNCGEPEIHIPANVTTTEANEIKETAVKAYKIMGCKGLARIDFFLTKSGDVILNEINTMPGFTPISMYPKLMQNMGMEYEYLVDKLIEQAIANSDQS
jgi:D-alanine-D-alanine ligase